ncbi:ATP-binding protein [Ilumatobacter sp.]|uniref:ATP-binding protein n=1 Tax=Ilumatobacter sp. TaxID=1967498 RepID=UPI003C3D3AFD
MNELVGTTQGGHELTVASDPAMIATLRHRVGTLVRDSGAPDGVVDDLELAVSELATNVVQHSDSPTIRMVLHREPSAWILVVDDADGLDELDPSTVPDPEALTGRGLFIVQAIMDDVQIVDDAVGRRVRCAKRIR